MESLELTESHFANKSILVTGSKGFLGSWLTKDLVGTSKKVFGVSLYEEGSEKIMLSNEEYDHYYLDISEYSTLEELFDKYKFDIVFHLAAQTQVLDAVKNPTKTFNSNIKGTWNILELCRKNNIPVVVASSDKAYGDSPNLPYLESHNLNGIYPYDVSKTVTDLLSRTYKETYDLNVAVLRCGNIYGGGDTNWDRLIPGVIRWLLNDEKPELRSNGNLIREWVYVEDVVQAYKQMGISILRKNNNHLSYNFSSGEHYSVMDIYKKISIAIKGKIVNPKYVDNSNEEIKDQILNSDLIKDDLGIESIYKFDDAIIKTIDWYKKYLKG